MKYMGSKRWMLQNGLGALIAQEVPNARRFVDLFSGSGAVAIHVAERYPIRVAAFDLQVYSAILANAVIARKAKLPAREIWCQWYASARTLRNRLRFPSARRVAKATVHEQRHWCSAQDQPVLKAYGGYYFSALQAGWIDSLRQALPTDEPARTVALAALLHTASKCAAAPGHTAQPFQPTRTARAYLFDAWRRDVVVRCRNVFSSLCDQHAKEFGAAVVMDANAAVTKISDGDLVFIDPPYSGVHYSRFYHVLETIARGGCGDVSGAGRYPAPNERPRSKYSVKSEAACALDRLFGSISARGGSAIVTFPEHQCSNGLSGNLVIELGRRHFAMKQQSVSSRLSTLGGNNNHRHARRPSRELILLLRPK
jgi:adenine-specific DNA-methyltransferase